MPECWLIAADWGTSALRVALLDPTGAVIEQRAGGPGALALAPGTHAAALTHFCTGWESSGARAFVIAGMAGSRQGWAEAPYADCPAGGAQLADQALRVAGETPFGLPAYLVPGVLNRGQGGDAAPDVMRGEETQILGALAETDARGGLFVLPGTHSKWARVDEERIVRFRTCMTGEFYALLRRQSVLARMLPEVEPEPDAAAFARGVRVAAEEGSLLSSAFGTRALALFGQMAADALPSYLSGLVIGEELRAMRTSGWYANDASPILVGEPALTRRYAEAFALNGMTARQASAGASWRGLAAIARRLPSLAAA